METEYIAALIGIGGTILGTVVGFFLSFAYERIQKKSRMNDDLQAAINRVLLVTLANKYPVVLGRLKEAIDTNAHVLHKNKSITSFYSKWLRDPALAIERDCANFIPNERIDELKNDLAAIKL